MMTFGDMLGPFTRINNVDIAKIQQIQMDSSARTTQFLTRKIDVMSVYLSNEWPQIEKRAKEIMGQLEKLMKSHDRFAKEFEILGGHLGNARKKYEDAEHLLDRFEDDLIRVRGRHEESEALLVGSVETKDL